MVLTDPQGSRVKCSPDTFSYTVGMVITSPPLTHAVGVAMANNRPLWFFRKGEALPARKNEVLGILLLRCAQGCPRIRYERDPDSCD